MAKTHINKRVSRLFVTTLAVLVLSTIIQAQAAVEKQDINLKGQGIKVPTISWSDTAVAPKAVLLAIHGGIQNAGNYSAIAQQLAPNGILIYSIDLRGHGKWLTAAKRPKLNYNASAEDVIILTKELRKEHPELPVFCIGESMGASMALHVVTKEPKLFDGVILASPGTSPAMGENTWADISGSIYDGARTLGSNINLRPYVKRISDDPRSVDEMIKDPRNRLNASVWDLIHSARFVRENISLAPKVQKNLPILVLAGREDHICSVKSVESLFKRFKSNDKTITLFNGTGHLLVTTNFLKPDVISTVSNWLNGQIAKHAH